MFDIGCGSAAAAPMLKDSGYSVTLHDTAGNSRCPEAQDFLFIQCGITQVHQFSGFDVATCIDVMEHIPTEMVDRVILSIAQTCTKGAVFGISGFEDAGKLHVTVKPAEWWQYQLAKQFGTVNRCEVTCKHPRQNASNWWLFRCGK